DVPIPTPIFHTAVHNALPMNANQAADYEEGAGGCREPFQRRQEPIVTRHARILTGRRAAFGAEAGDVAGEVVIAVAAVNQSVGSTRFVPDKPFARSGERLDERKITYRRMGRFGRMTER